MAKAPVSCPVVRWFGPCTLRSSVHVTDNIKSVYILVKFNAYYC